NNPLTGVLTFSSLMLKKTDENHPWKKDLENIVQQTTRCRNIVRALLDFARQRKPDKKEWDIHALLDRTLTFVENQARFQNIKIVKDFKLDLPMISIDADQIQQVFMNIVINAADAMGTEGGTLSIRTDFNNGIAEISIADTGCGMSKEHLSKLFTPFFTTKETGKGTGLGLAISYGIVQTHGGEIDVESEPGKGSTFRIKLPIEKQEGEMGRWGDRETRRKDNP
ncbi:MAG: two-component sensor histidine kinase, partial [Deltaproteobacteria bacterium]|nr:two-component sensor histidine kinase [Deltaproteobacteria bacterium]